MQLGKLLDAGTYGKVYNGKYKDQSVAIKKIKKKTLDKYNINPNIELNIFQKIDSPYIVKFIDWLEDENNIYHILEFVHTDLYQIMCIRFISEMQALKYIKNIAKGLIYLNLNDIAHLDIKPENILVNFENETKITDFGHSSIIEYNKNFTEVRGTRDYLAPECFCEDGYTYRVDVWALGVIYYELVEKKLPFTGLSDEEVYTNILKYNVSFSNNNKSKGNIIQLLHPNAEDRIVPINILNLSIC